MYLQDVLDLCTESGDIENDDDESSQFRKSVLIMVPVRLGGERFNPSYSSYLKEVLSLPSCCGKQSSPSVSITMSYHPVSSQGIIGGQPRHSLFFVGFQDEKLLYLDPHYCQKAVDVTEPNFPLDSYHCPTPRKAKLPTIDPSCAIGFFLKSRRQFLEFSEGIEQLLERTRQADEYPIFVLNQSKYVQSEPEASSTPEKVFRMNYRLVDSKGNVQKVINSEEFILL